MKRIYPLLTLQLLILNTYSVFAAEEVTLSDLDSITGFRWLFNRFMGMITICAVTALAVCLVQYIIADNEQAAANAKSRAKLVMSAWIAGSLLGIAISAFFAMVSGWSI